MVISETTRNAFSDELEKIGFGLLRSGSMPQSAQTVAGKTRFLGAVRKTVRPRNLMKTSGVGSKLLLSAGTVAGTAGSLGVMKAKKQLDDQRLGRMQERR